MCHSTPMLYSCTVFYRILHFICALFQHWTGQQNEIKTRVKASKLSYFYPGVLARASVCLAFLVWRFFFGGGGRAESNRVGEMVVSLWGVRRVSENTASHVWSLCGQ